MTEQNFRNLENINFKNPINPILCLLSFCVSITVASQLYIFYCSLSPYQKRKNHIFLLFYCTDIFLLFSIPILNFSYLLFNFKTPYFFIQILIYMSQILFKDIAIYLLLRRYKFIYWISFSTVIDILCLSIPYRDLGRLVFICITTSEYLALLLISWKLKTIDQLKIMIGMKILEIVNIFDSSNSRQSLVELLTYLIQFNVIKSRISFNTVIKNYTNKKEFEDEGLSCLNEVYT